MFIDIIIWLAIGFLPTYGAMELSWRMSRRVASNRNNTTITEAMVASVRSKVTDQQQETEVQQICLKKDFVMEDIIKIAETKLFNLLR